MKNLKKTLSLVLALALLLQLFPLLPVSAEEAAPEETITAEEEVAPEEEFTAEDIFPSEFGVPSNAVCIQDSEAVEDRAPEADRYRTSSDGAIPANRQTEDPFEINDGLFRYSVRFGEATLVGKVQEAPLEGDVSIPASVQGYPVTAIGGHALRGETKISALTVPGSVREIREFAFAYLQADAVVLEEGLEILGSEVFDGATIRSNLVLPESLTEIGYRTFMSCKGFDTLTVPSSRIRFCSTFECVGFSWVYGRSVLVEEAAMDAPFYETPDPSAEGAGLNRARYIDLDTGEVAAIKPEETTVNGIEYKIYSSHAVLRSGRSAVGRFTVPDTVAGKPVAGVCGYAFEQAPSLTAITFPDSVEWIGTGVLKECPKLQSVDFGDGIRVLQRSVCYSCNKLETVVMPRYLESIGDYAFDSDSSLGRIALPDTVTSIGCDAFCNCHNLQLISYPSRLEQIGVRAFAGCYKQRFVYLPPSFRYESLYMFDKWTSIASSLYYIYHPGTPAEEYLQKLKENGTVYSYALPQTGRLYLSMNGVYRQDGKEITLLFCPVLEKGDASAVPDLYVGGLPVTTIGSRAFRPLPETGFESSIILTPTVTTVQTNAFSAMKGHILAYIPKNVKSIDTKAFSGTKNNTIFGKNGTAASTFARTHSIPFREYEIEFLPFSDIPSGKWYYESVLYVYYNGLMQGESSTKFKPGNTMTRAMLVQVLYNLAGSKCESYGFTDVSDGAWYADAVNWAAANGIVNGVSETEFAPNRSVTREQTVTILHRFAQKLGPAYGSEDALDGFADVGKVSDYAIEAFRWAVAEGIVQGSAATTLAPQGRTTRAQIATILMRFVKWMAT